MLWARFTRPSRIYHTQAENFHWNICFWLCIWILQLRSYRLKEIVRFSNKHQYGHYLLKVLVISAYNIKLLCTIFNVVVNSMKKCLTLVFSLAYSILTRAEILLFFFYMPHEAPCIQYFWLICFFSIFFADLNVYYETAVYPYWCCS